MTLSSRAEVGGGGYVSSCQGQDADAMGSQEVLGQAARLASSGLLLQVLSVLPALPRAAARVRWGHALGPSRPRSGAAPTWTPAVEEGQQRPWWR